MKALVIGPNSADFNLGYNQSIARALTQCGFETKIVEYFFGGRPPGLFNRVRIDGGMLFGQRKYHNEYIALFNQKVLACYHATSPDLILVVEGSKLSEQTLDAMNQAVKVLWCHDAVSRIDISLGQLRNYDLRYVFDASDVLWLAEHYNMNSRFLPMGFDPEVYHPVDHTIRDVDVCFVGSYYPSRRLMLERLAKDFPNHTLRFYGRHVRYREPSTWLRCLYYVGSGQGSIFVNQCLDPTEVNRLYARSKICVNMHHAQSTLGCNPRVFEIMGAGAFQLVDAIPYVRDNLKEIITTYDGYESMRQAVACCLSDDRLRRDTVVRARQVALNHHTFVHRIHQVVRDCNLIPASC